MKTNAWCSPPHSGTSGAVCLDHLLQGPSLALEPTHGQRYVRFTLSQVGVPVWPRLLQAGASSAAVAGGSGEWTSPPTAHAGPRALE